MECVQCNKIGAQLTQWIFGAIQGHPIFDHIIKNVVTNSIKAPSFYDRFCQLNKVMHMTGPSALSDGVMTRLIEKGTCAIQHWMVGMTTKVLLYALQLFRLGLQVVCRYIHGIIGVLKEMEICQIYLPF